MRQVFAGPDYREIKTAGIAQNMSDPAEGKKLWEVF